MASVDISQAESPQPSFEFTATHHHNNFTSNLVTLRQYEKMTDVTLKCQNVQLTGHKVVLAAACPFFDKLFGVKAKENSPDVVVLDFIAPDVLATILDFIYTGKAKLNTHNVQSICAACDDLELTELKEGCDQFMSENVLPANCLGFHIFSKQYNLVLTLEESKHCMLTKLKDILRLALDAEWRLLEEDDLIEYISDDHLEVEDEGMVFEVVKKWVGVDVARRRATVDNIMEHVRLAFCTPSTLHKIIEKSPLMDSKKCLMLLNEAKSYQLVPEERKAIASARTKPRIFRDQLLLFDGGNNAAGKCWYYKEEEKVWAEFAKLPVETLVYFSVCPCTNEIIFTGGQINGLINNFCWAFNLSDRRWMSLPPLSEVRYHHSTVSVEDEVYVIGGYGKNEAISSMEKLDTRRQSWEKVARMQKQLYHQQTVTMGDKVFVVGGLDRGGYASKTTQVYDVQSGQWETKADMLHASKYGAAAVLGSNIYVVGENCQVYDPGQDMWTKLTPPCQTRSYPAAAMWKGRVLLAGGSNKNDIEEYEPDKDQWTTWTLTLPAGLSYHYMVKMNQYIGQA